MKIALQQRLKQPLPLVIGPCDYMEFRTLLEQIDHLLVTSKIEDQFIAAAIEKNSAYSSNQKKLEFLYRSLRIMILMTLTGNSYREMARRIAESELFRYFIGINDIDRIKTPSKSTIKRMEQIWSAADIEALVHKLNAEVSDPTHSLLLLNEEKPISIDEVFVDSTCINANIHYPVDWLLLRDAVRTLIASIILIRRQGLRHRMPKPLSLLKKINTVAMEMTQCSRNRKGKKVRKRIFRKMKTHLKVVVRHAERYHKILEANRHHTQWSDKQTQQVLQRMNNVIDQIPSIISVAHSRIISEKKVSNEEKILSLYEKDVHVIKRGKFGADVEFGNGYYLAEQRDGLIIDFEYFKDYPTSDSQILMESLERIKSRYRIKLVASDRGFNTKRNDRYLAEENIINATCPKNARSHEK